MNHTATAAFESKHRSLPPIALFSLLVGFVLPFLCWTFWLPKIFLLIACGAEILAIVLGLIAWRRWLARIAVVGAAAFCLLGAWLGLSGLPTYPLKIKPAADWMNPLDAHWITQSAAKPYSIRTDSELKKCGDDSLRFELRAGDAWVDQTFVKSFRAEVATKEFPPAGSVKWYAFSVFFPAGFPIEDNRLVLRNGRNKRLFAGPD